VCGQLTGTRFDAASDATCGLEAFTSDPAVHLRAPTRSGTWTVGVSACAGQNLVDAYNAVCGTWYATLKIRS